MDAPLDLRRLSELRALEGMSDEAWGQLVRDLGGSLRQCEQRLHAALKRGDLRDVVQAAHLARNDALMLGARELNEALALVEQEGRAGRAERLPEHLAGASRALAATLAALDEVVRTRRSQY